MQHYIFTKTFMKLIKNQNTCVYQQLEVAGFLLIQELVAQLQHNWQTLHD